MYTNDEWLFKAMSVTFELGKGNALIIHITHKEFNHIILKLLKLIYALIKTV